MSQLHRAIVNTASAPQPIGAYSQAIRTTSRELVFVAGQVALDLAGNLIGEDDAAAQTRQAFENIGSVLEGVGASFSDVVEFTTYLVGRDSVQPFLEARAEIFPTMFPDADYPPDTRVSVAGLVRDEFLVEIKAVAALP